jgi:hypothetical protein
MKTFYITLLFFIPLLSISCSSIIYEAAYPTLFDGKYDSEFPYKNSSDQLEDISKSIKRINCLAFYKSYIFPDSVRVTLKSLAVKQPGDYTSKTVHYDQSFSGTGTIVYNRNGKVALLTCAHILDFQDTVYSFYTDAEGNITNELQSISIKTGQTIYIPEFPERGEVEVLAIDRKNDIALIGKQYSRDYVNQFHVFNYPLGKSEELEWGSFVYAFGFPMSQKMISKAIVSSPNKDSKGGFLIDAVFNEGFSGGIVLAIRDGVPNFELVGLLVRVPVSYDFVVKPAAAKPEHRYNPAIPYTGDVFVQQMKNIKYGIIQVIPTNVIVDFFKSQNNELQRNGYDFSKFIR